jgi:DNA-binding transcriptional regulator YdaS (Cro superfamily)
MKIAHPLDRPNVRAQISSALGVSTQAITNWKSVGVPAIHCLTIERATNGVVTRQELRPDDYWLIWPDLPAPKVAA